MENEKLTPDMIEKLSLDEKKPHAREMFFGYAKITEIARTLVIALPTVKSWVYGSNLKGVGWKVERESAKVQLVKDLSADKRGLVYNMVNNSLFLIHDFVEDAKKQAIKGKPVDIRTAEKLTGILMNLHKIVENENDGKEHGDYTVPANVGELTKRLEAADPFGKDKVIETEKVDDEEVM